MAPDLRSIAALLPSAILTDYSSEPPKRGTIADRMLDTLVPRGLGQEITIPATETTPALRAFRYEVHGRSTPSGAVVWFHGGGFIAQGPWLDHATCTRLARDLGVVVFSPDYRLAPEHPFPAGPEDCYSTLKWVHEHADELGVDPAKIAVGGESAGGGLAAMVAQMAQDRGLPVAFQALIYPMLDDSTVLADRGEDVGRLVWNTTQNRNAWRWFLGHDAGEDEPRPYAAAARREDLSELPPAWIGVGTIDLFHDEDVEYAKRLREAGVDVEFHAVPGMFHAADAFRFVPSMRAFRDSMVAALSPYVG